jgi:hypothetical protein
MPTDGSRARSGLTIDCIQTTRRDSENDRRWGFGTALDQGPKLLPPPLSFGPTEPPSVRLLRSPNGSSLGV